MDRIIVVKAFLLLPLFLFFHVCAESDAPAAPMEKAEQEALYLAIQGFVGKLWNGSGLYPDPCGWTPIQGVSCDIFNDLWYVTVISIGPILDNSLICTRDAKFSPYLFELKHMRSLTFFNCFFSIHQPAIIPSQGWEKLAGSLETLDFRSNKGLSGEIPASLGQLIHLQSLVLEENTLTGELPQELGQLVHLKRLAISGNRLTGRLPASLGSNLAQLLILDLSRNSLSGPLPTSLGGLASLLKLDISNNLLDGKLPSELGNMKSLTLLDLKNNNLSGGLTRSLQGLTSIQDLVLANNPMAGNLMEIVWEDLRNLTTLDFSNMGLTGEIPETIVGLMRLRLLALNNNHLSGSVTPKLAALPCLKALYLNENNFTGELAFSEEFYDRMGTRFAAWNNPDLCHSVAGATEHVPLGVEQCKHQQKVSINNPDSKNKMSSVSPYQYPNAHAGASSGFSSSPVTGFFGVILMQEVVAAVLVLGLVL